MKENPQHQLRVMMDRDNFIKALDADPPDLILSDNEMPRFSAIEALRIVKQRNLYTPFILVTGTVSEEYAATMIKEGADDYILKDRMVRLPAAIEGAINQRRAQKELADYKYALDESAIVAITNQKGIIVYANDNFCKISKYSREEIIGQDHRIINSGYHPAAFIKGLWTTIASGKIWHGEFRNKAKDGSFYWVDTTIVPFLNSRNKPYQYLTIRIDITKKKKAEQKIITSEKNLKTIFDNTSEGFILTDTHGIIKAFNDKAAEEVLFNTEQTIKSGESIYDYVDEERRIGFMEVFTRILKGETIHYDRSYENSAGSITWISFSFTPVKADNKVIGVCTSGRDITERKLTEQQIEFDHNNLHALINNTLDLVWSVNLNFLLITFNQAFSDAVHSMSGKTPVSETNVLDLGFSEKINARYKNFYDRAFQGELFTITEHYTQPVEIYSEISFYPIREKDKVIGTACFSRDITQKMKAELALKQSYFEKEQLGKRLSAILNTLPANIALLNSDGDVIDINEAWKNFAAINGFVGNHYGLGSNYITVCENSGDDEGRKVAAGIAAIVGGLTAEFVHEYSCDSPTAKRWFRMIATALSGKDLQGAVVMHINITEIKELEEERLRSKEDEQRKITRAILEAQEKERSAIGAELHDNVNQILVGTNLLLGMIETDPSKTNEFIRPCINNIMQAISENRKIAHELVAPDGESETLLQQVNRLCNTMLEKAGIYTKILNRGFSETKMNTEQKLAVYRIIQEQCTNIVKYAKASSVVMIMNTTEHEFRLVIKDDGVGMDKNKVVKGIGLRNIASRLRIFNGSLTIDSEPGDGFTMEIKIPLE